VGEPLKAFFSPALVHRIGASIRAVHPPFPAEAFARDATRGLDALELLDRARHIAAALAAHLPADFEAAIELLLRSLGPAHPGDEILGAGMEPFFYLPHTVFVAERGLDHFERAMEAQHALTQRCSCEFSVRAFLAHDPERTMAILERWTADPSAHVRRLVSEGTRLRLPWGVRVLWLDANPRRILGLLERLRDDPSPMVRRSVANNLNDLGKSDPALLEETCAAWLEHASEDRRALVEHALRSAVKRGESGALALLGFGAAPEVVVEDVRFSPERAAIGERVAVSFVLRSTARTRQSLLVDLRVHFVNARGTSPKVFKLERVDLPARDRVALSKSVSLAIHTTRTPRPGAHRVEVLVNGAPFPAGAFEVVARRG